MSELLVTQFKGMRNDMSDKTIAPEYWFKCENFNQDEITGAAQILFPSIIKAVSAGNRCNGGFEYRFLNSVNILQVQKLSIFAGTLYKDSIGTPASIIAGLLDDDYQFVSFNDKVFLACENQIPKVYEGQSGVVYDMGALRAEVLTSGGNPNFTDYRYIVTFVTAGGEEITGAISNTVSAVNKQILLNLPIGYAACLSRNIYRNKASAPNDFYFLANVGDNSTLSIIDNALDTSLLAHIGVINNPVPKPKFLQSQYSKIVAIGDPLFPTQLWNTDTNNEVLDGAAYVDISNNSNDNTPTRGMAPDVGRIYCFTDLNAFLVNVSGTTTTVTPIRGNTGTLSGYSPVNVPQNGDFPNGVFYFSNDGTLRLLNGIYGSNLPNSLENINSDNYGQYLKGTLQGLVNAALSKGIYYDYKYHLAFPEQRLVVTYDIRTQAFFTYHNINVNNWFLYDNILYAGTSDGNIERWYSDVKYRGADMLCTLESPQLMVSEELKNFKTLRFYVKSTPGNKTKLKVIVEDDYNNPIEGDIAIEGGDYSSLDFSRFDYDTSYTDVDIREMYINRWGRWMKFILQSTSGRLFINGYRLLAEEVSNKEATMKGR